MTKMKQNSVLLHPSTLVRDLDIRQLIFKKKYTAIIISIYSQYALPKTKMWQSITTLYTAVGTEMKNEKYRRVATRTG